jgi:hypothetical protein
MFRIYSLVLMFWLLPIVINWSMGTAHGGLCTLAASCTSLLGLLSGWQSCTAVLSMALVEMTQSKELICFQWVARTPRAWDGSAHY